MSILKISLLPRTVLIIAGNTALLYALHTSLPSVLTITGNFVSIILIAAIFTALNMFVRPILSLITLPIKLFATLLAFFIVNGIMVQVLVFVLQQLTPTITSMQIGSGLIGWLIVTIVLGLGNWILRTIL